MHLAKTALILSLGFTVIALPGTTSTVQILKASSSNHHLASSTYSPSPSKTPSPQTSAVEHVKNTTKTPATKASTAPGGLRTDYAALCEGNALSPKLWKEFGMKTWISYLSNLVPSGEMSFVDYMAKNTPGVSQFNCEVGQPCVLVPTEDACNTTPPMTNPKNWAIIYAITYFHNWVNVLIESVSNAQTGLNTMNGFLFAHFTTHEFKLSANTWKESLISGVMTGVGALLSLAKIFFPEGSLLSYLSVAASGVGASATIQSGLLRKVLTETVGVVETQIQEVGNMDKWLFNVLEGMRNGIKSWGESVVNGIVYQSHETGMYYQNSSGIVAWLSEGDFANYIPENYTVSVDAAALKSIFGVAVSDLWVQEEVYLVNTTHAWTYAWRDYESLKIDKKDITRVTHNGDIFFAIKNTKDTAPDQEYNKVPGIDKLKDVGLDIHEVIDASVWSQNHIGFNSTWPVDMAMHYATSDDPPPHGLFMNIPICQLGQMPHPPQDLFVRKCSTVDIAAECQFKRYINWSCSKQIQITNGIKQPWPYKLYNPKW